MPGYFAMSSKKRSKKRVKKRVKKSGKKRGKKRSKKQYAGTRRARKMKRRRTYKKKSK